MHRIFTGIVPKSILTVISLGIATGQTAPTVEKPAWAKQHDWKVGVVTDLSLSTGQQQGILTGDMNTVDTWTYTILGNEGSYTIREEIMRGLITGHAPLTRTEGTETFYYLDGARLVIITGLRGKGKNEKPVTSKYVVIKFAPNAVSTELPAPELSNPKTNGPASAQTGSGIDPTQISQRVAAASFAYVVTGCCSGKAMVSYQNATGGQEQMVVKLPWVSVFDPQPGFIFTLLGQVQDQSEGASMTVEVYSHGKPLKTAHSSGPFTTAIASGSLPR